LTETIQNDPHLKRFLLLPMVVLLMIRVKCSCLRAKSAKVSDHLPLRNSHVVRWATRECEKGVLLFWLQRWLLKGRFFWRKFFGMLIFPPMPESYDDLLENAGNRDGEECSEESEEFCACEEREKGHDGMDPNGLAEDARP
jgi:hypothetical protein